MKKSLFLMLAAATAMVGCKQQQMSSNDLQESKGGISFETHINGSTKGASKESFVLGDRFEAIGYSAETDFTGTFNVPTTAKLLFTGDATYFPNERAVVSANAGDAGALRWEYRPMINWPVAVSPAPALKASFVAFSPEATTANKITAAKVTAVANTAAYKIGFEVIGGVKKAEYTQEGLAAARLKNVEQIDLLNAQNLNIATVPTNGVALDFKHALTKVRFSVKGGQPKGILRIVSVTLSGVVNKGNLALMYDQTNAATATYLGGWSTTPTDTVGFPVSLNSVNAASIGVGKIVPLVDNHESLLMIPQNLANVTAQVVYALSLDGGVTWQQYTAGDGARKISLATAGIPYWKPNMSINYIMDINPGSTPDDPNQLVSFAPSLTAWDVVDEQYVPKFNPDKTAQTFTTIELKTGDVVSASGNAAWITMKEGTGADQALSSSVAVGANGNCVFKVLANSGAARKETIKITRANPAKVIVIEVDQAGI